MECRLTGLIAAACTPMRDDGSLDLEQVPAIVDYLERAGVVGLLPIYTHINGNAAFLRCFFLSVWS